MKRLYRRPFIVVLTVVLISHAVLTFVAWQARSHVGYFVGADSQTTLVKPADDYMVPKEYWSQFDSGFYQAIATRGYLYDASGNARLTAAFFPLYPYLLRVVYWVTGDVVTAGVVLGFMISVGVGYIVYLLMRELGKGKRTSVLTAAAFIVLPQMFYVGAILSDGLFLLLSLLGVLYLLRKNWYGAYVVAMLLPVTKLLGIVFVLPLFGALYAEYGRVLSIKYYPLMGSFIGGILVLLHNYRIAHDPFFFRKVVEQDWHRHNDFIGMFTKPFTSVSLALLTLIGIFVLTVVLLQRKKLGIWWTVWGGLMVLIPLLSSPLGQTRYAVANVPFLYALYLIVARWGRRWQNVWLVVSAVGFVVVGTVWMMGHPILQ